MTPHQALDVFNPDNERSPLPKQRQAFAVLVNTLSDGTDAEGYNQQPKERKDKRED